MRRERGLYILIEGLEGCREIDKVFGPVEVVEDKEGRRGCDMPDCVTLKRGGREAQHREHSLVESVDAVNSETHQQHHNRSCHPLEHPPSLSRVEFEREMYKGGHDVAHDDDCHHGVSSLVGVVVGPRPPHPHPEESSDDNAQQHHLELEMS